MMIDWEPTATLAALRLRAELYALIRRFFAQRGVLEVETPMLSEAGNTDPNIASFALDFAGPKAAGATRHWLRTSPEYPLKRLLAAGIGDCYELGRVFRNGELGARHNPEFSMLEWYRLGWNHRRLMDETAELVRMAMDSVQRRTRVHVTSFRALYREHLDVDPLCAADEALRMPLDDFRIDPDGLTRDDWLDLLMTHLIQPNLPADRITLVYDYPASQCALARIRADDPPVAERFELYLGGLELANGYHELSDAAEQGERLRRDLAIRAARGAIHPPRDQRLLAALAVGLPPCAGVALGMERLLMAMLGSEHIAETLAFGFERA